MGTTQDNHTILPGKVAGEALRRLSAPVVPSSKENIKNGHSDVHKLKNVQSVFSDAVSSSEGQLLQTDKAPAQNFIQAATPSSKRDKQKDRQKKEKQKSNTEEKQSPVGAKVLPDVVQYDAEGYIISQEQNRGWGDQEKKAETDSDDDGEEKKAGKWSSVSINAESSALPTSYAGSQITGPPGTLKIANLDKEKKRKEKKDKKKKKKEKKDKKKHKQEKQADQANIDAFGTLSGDDANFDKTFSADEPEMVVPAIVGGKVTVGDAEAFPTSATAAAGLPDENSTVITADLEESIGTTYSFARDRCVCLCKTDQV